MKIDLNCDLGESFGPYSIGNDRAIMPYISSANVACGMHAGDPTTMRNTILLAIENGVEIGAHPGFADREGFGRKVIHYPDNDLFNLLVYQIGALQKMVEAEKAVLRHVKPHGALYNMAAKDPELADVVARAVKHLDPDLILVGLAGSELVRAGKEQGLKIASEIFADRRYTKEGFLVPRSQKGSVISDPSDALAQIEKMLLNDKVQANTICIHGDHKESVQFALEMNGFLKKIGVAMMPLHEICF